MKYGWGVFFLFFFGLVVAVFSRMNTPHGFSDNDCGLCHLDVKQDAALRRPISSSRCTGCHSDIIGKLSHPVDISPRMTLPADMPLVEGKVSCISCHFVHPSSLKSRQHHSYLLRRPGRGAVFCSACHRLDGKGHLLFANVHSGTLNVTDRTRPLDLQTLQCVECHDRHLNRPVAGLGAGAWQHFTAGRLNHPIGVSYDAVTARKPGAYRPRATLPQEIRLFNGKIGCGTCHNVYSKETFMLTVGNHRSRLCLECHIK